MRRGNMNEKVKIYRYVTKGTFDAYNWGLVENKQKFIGQIMTSKSPARSIEDVDATALSYAEVKMLATGDPRIKEKMDLDIQVAKLKMLKANHQAQQYETQDSIVKYYPQQIAQTQLMIDVLSGNLPVLEAHPIKEDSFSMTIQDKVYTERKAAGEAIVAACKSMTDPEKPIELGEYRGFAMRLALRACSFQVSLKHRMTYTAELSEDIVGNITRINNALERIPKNLEANKQRLATLHTQLETLKEEAGRPFPLEEELAVKAARLSQLNTELDNDGRSSAPSQEDGEAPGREDGDIGLYTKVSPEEKEIISQKMELLGTTNLRAYLRKMAVDGYIVQLDMWSVVELVKLLRSISSNINQIARRCNETRNLYAQDVEDLQKGCNQVWKEVHALLKKFETL